MLNVENEAVENSNEVSKATEQLILTLHVKLDWTRYLQRHYTTQNN